MKAKILLITGAITLAVFIGSFVYAGGMGGGTGGRGWGGGGHGMMGGGHMMDYGRGYSPPYQDQYNRYSGPDESYRYDPGETARLRKEIREKRRELSELYRSEKPDQDKIDEKIDELSRLEAELDQKTLGR